MISKGRPIRALCREGCATSTPRGTSPGPWAHTATFTMSRPGVAMNQRATEIQAPADVVGMLAEWIESATAYAHAHRLEAVKLKKRHAWLGTPSVVLSTVVGTSIFAAIQEAAQSTLLKSVLALLSMSAAALAALVTFNGFAEKSASHRIASEEYGDVARRLQVLRTSIAAMRPSDWKNVLDGYSQQLDAIGRRADIPESMLVDEALYIAPSAPSAPSVPFPPFAASAVPPVRPAAAASLSCREGVRERYPRLRRGGFSYELQRVFSEAAGAR